MAACLVTGVATLAQKPDPAAGLAPGCGDPFAAQVLLDRQGFSSGQIDGNFGNNSKRALAAFQSAQSLEPTGTLECATWQALSRDQSQATTTYTVTAADLQGLLSQPIPDSLPAQAALPALGYRTVAEKLAERFHMAPALLAKMNTAAELKALKEGTTLTVANVTPFDTSVKPGRDPAAAQVTVEVSKEGSLRVLGGDNRVLFFAPVTSGSAHDPLPIGQWKVNSVSWMPPFHYNPDLFWDAKATDEKATIKPGPNNPVGVAWIDITVEHYGIHGTPEPSRIGYAQSHGCVRLTNWDAARLASLVAAGTPVVFK